MEKIICGDSTIYIDELFTIGKDGNPYKDNSLRDFINIDSLKEALNPIANIGKMIKEGVDTISPAELEVELQLKLGISNDKLLFAIVKTEAEAHLSVKFVWKTNEN